MTDNEIIKALECCASVDDGCLTDCPLYDGDDSCFSSLLKPMLDLINRQKHDIERFKNRQKPTAASGYKIENGKVVFFTNMLGGCKIVKENLEEVVKTLNELLQEAYAKDEIAFALKCKTEELETAKAEIKRLKNSLAISKKETKRALSSIKGYQDKAIKEFAERVKPKLYFGDDRLDFCIQYNIDTLVKEMVGEDK